MSKRWPIRSHFIVFVLLSAFAVAQLTWWIVFQFQEGTRVAQIQQQLWLQQLAMAREELRTATDAGQFQQWLVRTFPDLELNDRGRVVVRADAVQRLDDVARQRMRMFISEGIFFSLLLFVGVGYMYWMLRRDLQFERRQSMFLASTSHELKTPITSLQLYLDTLIERDLPPPQRTELLSTMRKDLARLTALIERLLQAQKLLGKSDTVKLVRTNLTEETHVVLDEIYNRFDLKGFQFRSRLDADLYALAHPERWHVLVRNLLENAFKYSPGGGVIDILLTRRGRHAVLEVADQGIGIPPAELERVFARFYRVGNEDTRRTAGTGLGLFLVREIAESFGGRAFASSPGEGHGAKFTVSVPVLEDRTDG